MDFCNGITNRNEVTVGQNPAAFWDRATIGNPETGHAELDKAM